MGEARCSPAIRKRALARRLVELRKAAGLTTLDVQRRLGWSATKLNWIEKARWVEPVTDQVVDLCELYGAEGAGRDDLVRLAREARERGWWMRYADVVPVWLTGFEAGASAISTFETARIPDLLQAPGYIRHIARAAGMKDPARARRLEDAWVRRQQILTCEPGPCHLHAIIDENALARITDPGVRRDQLAHLAEAGGRPNVDIQILPFAAGVYPAAGGAFTCLSFPDPADHDIVFPESGGDGRMLEESGDVARYRARLERFRAASLGPDETSGYLKRQTG
jgi:transcriptional regulator with XRE-family HTH domain